VPCVPAALEIRFPATLEGFEQAFAALRRALDLEQLDAGPRYNVELVFEEIVANIVRHGAGGGHRPDVRVTLGLGTDTISLTFEDDGVPFDPCRRPNPPPRSPDHTGGFGLMLVHRAASALSYQRTAECHNRLTATLPRAATGVVGGSATDR
jgi:anti-sigma regulatory factor (Ser/Thr protein kinase)